MHANRPYRKKALFNSLQTCTHLNVNKVDTPEPILHYSWFNCGLFL